MKKKKRMRRGSLKEDKLYREIGYMLCYLHSIEEVMIWVTWLIDSSIQKTNHPFEDYGKSTLGRLMNIVRKRVSVNKSFDSVFKRFLKNRNRFIHDFSWSHNIGEKNNYKHHEKFLVQLGEDSTKVKGVFIRYLIQVFALWDDNVTEKKMAAHFRRKGWKVPDNLLDWLYGRFKNPLNIEFNMA